MPTVFISNSMRVLVFHIKCTTIYTLFKHSIYHKILQVSNNNNQISKIGQFNVKSAFRKAISKCFLIFDTNEQFMKNMCIKRNTKLKKKV